MKAQSLYKLQPIQYRAPHRAELARPWEPHGYIQIDWFPKRKCAAVIATFSEALELPDRRLFQLEFMPIVITIDRLRRHPDGVVNRTLLHKARLTFSPSQVDDRTSRTTKTETVLSNQQVDFFPRKTPQAVALGWCSRYC
jgi:hypothetical protein